MRAAQILLALMVALSALLVVSAHEGATGIVKERMDAMTTMSHAMKAIGKSIEANRDLTTSQVSSTLRSAGDHPIALAQLRAACGGLLGSLDAAARAGTSTKRGI